MPTTDYAVTGMTCQHCVSAVTTELEKLPGVREVLVDLVPGGASTVHLTGDTVPVEAQVRSAIDEAGYEVQQRVDE